MDWCFAATNAGTHGSFMIAGLHAAHLQRSRTDLLGVLAGRRSQNLDILERSLLGQNSQLVP